MERKECSIFLHTFDSFDISFVGGKRGCVVIVAAVAVIWNVDRRRGFWDRLVQNFCCKCNYRSLVDIILIFFFVNSCHIRSDTGENAQKREILGVWRYFGGCGGRDRGWWGVGKKIKLRRGLWVVMAKVGWKFFQKKAVLVVLLRQKGVGKGVVLILDCFTVWYWQKLGWWSGNRKEWCLG